MEVSGLASNGYTRSLLGSRDPHDWAHGYG